MGRSENETLLPIDRYASIMQIPPTHFNQLQGAKAPLDEGCDDIWDQDDRDLLAWTMAQAEEMIAQELGFWEAPKFLTAEPIPFELPGVKSGNVRSAISFRQLWETAEVTTEWGLVQNYGTELLTLIQANAGVQYENLDNDPLDREETARIGTSIYADLPACASVCEVAVFFREADIPEGKGDAADPRWEIRPTNVDIDGTTMRITAESSLFVWPHLWELTRRDSFSPDDSDMWKWDFNEANLVDSVDVYCRTVNPQLPVTVFWDGVCNCTGICEHQTQTACAYNTDNRRGFFAPRPATWNGTRNIEAAPLHNVPPESVTVNYRAGYPTNGRTCKMNPQLERAIVKLTNALLPEPPCGFCDAAKVRWKNDREGVDPLTPEAASLPWDLYAKGALEAWRIVKKFAMGRGGKMGRGYR